MRRAVGIGLGFASLLCTSVHAQVVPQINPGVIQNDIERQQRQFEQRSQTPKIRGPAVIGGEREKTPLLKPGGPKFKLKKVEFDSSKFLSPEELEAIAKKYVGQQVDISGIQQLVADVNAVYAEKELSRGSRHCPNRMRPAVSFISS
jgi:hemolysin activation/secretion protein